VTLPVDAVIRQITTEINRLKVFMISNL